MKLPRLLQWFYRHTSRARTPFVVSATRCYKWGMPRKGDRHPPKCVKCENPARPKLHRGELKGYLRTCKDHYNYHHKPGANHHNASKQGRRKNADGYIQVLDPHRKKAKKTGSNYVLEHRLVMEAQLGRKLKDSEIVHHKNGLRDDNRPDNLMVTTSEHHANRTLVPLLQERIRELERMVRILFVSTYRSA